MFNTLSISSPQELYKMILNNDEINSHPKFNNFLDAMSDYYYGCECEHERLFEVSKYNYNKLSKDGIVDDSKLKNSSYLSDDSIRIEKIFNSKSGARYGKVAGKKILVSMDDLAKK